MADLIIVKGGLMVNETLSEIGAFSSQEIRSLIDGGVISSNAKIEEDQIQPASLDLTLSDRAFRVRGSFMPRKGEKIEDLLKEITLYEQDLTVKPILEKGAVYIVELNESLKLKDNFYAYANNKSSTGRINLQTRLLADGNPRYELVERNYNGKLYAEVIPKSFLASVNPGDSLNQLRLFTGDSRIGDVELGLLYDNYKGLLYDKDSVAIPRTSEIIDNGLVMSVDLECDVVAYVAKNVDEVVEVSKKKNHDPRDFWERITRPADGRLMLNKGQFYILTTREFIRVPPELSAEMAAYDVTKGEFRTHYAGFFDGGFGHGEDGSVMGTPATLEVIPNDNAFILRHGQPICKMIYEKNRKLPDKIYGGKVLSSNYLYQRGPSLGKQFKDWNA